MTASLKSIPSVDRILSSLELATTLTTFGHQQCTVAIREVLAEIRAAALSDDGFTLPDIEAISEKISSKLSKTNASSLRPVINLTGTVLHTNLGRAYLPRSAMEAISEIATGASNLEYDLERSQRGDRDDHIEALICELTGAEAATVVNNNAAAVMLCLNSLAEGREVCISRGELVEIGGSFRIPEVMQKSGCILAEVGATNRTHPKDYQQAINDRTALLLKVHTSNYEIRGFTEEVSYGEIAAVAKEYGLPFMADLGSGTLVNLETYGLEHEPTVQEVIETGADVVTFSGDKLLGGPQTGIIAGRKDIIAAIKKNPLKRALRVDKMTIAALHHVLKLYKQPETLAEELPTLRYLARKPTDLQPMADALVPLLQNALGEKGSVTQIEVASQIGSGALPLDQLPSVAIEITPADGTDSSLQAIAKAFRHLSVPVIGRLKDGRLLFDLRTLDQAATLSDLLDKLEIG